MNNTYQAVYDAAFKQFDISWILPRALEAVQTVEMEMSRPSVLFKPKLSLDGNTWIALYGDDLQTGVVGCGDTPEAAMRDFDLAWSRKPPPGEVAG